MKLQYLSSASVVIEDEGVKILCDPWLVDGAFMGSWYHYPPLKLQPEDFNDVDYIYISHIHPDHIDPKTLNLMDKNIPVIINNYISKFLKKNIENLGFKVQEFNHNERVHLKKNLYMRVLAADNCDPQLCSQFIGCASMENKFGATQIDSMCVIENGKEVVVNVNDCPWELAQHSAKIIKNEYEKIDLLLMGYAGASGYPQCFEMSDNEKEIEAKKKIKKFLIHGENYVNLFQPKYYLPFAGRYTLSGKLFLLNKFRGNPELEEAYDYYISSKMINQSKHHCLILNNEEFFDITLGRSSKNYEPIDPQMKKKYIQDILSHVKFDYENDPIPSSEELFLLLPKCFERFEKMRKQIGFVSETRILLDLSDGNYVSISCNGNGYEIISKDDASKLQKYMIFSVDKRLLLRALKGPQFAHWNNVECGSHIWHKKVPDTYERGLYYCLNFFHK